MASILLRRPRAANRVNLRMAEELALACAAINQDDAIRCVMLSGSGDVFSAGWETPPVTPAAGLSRYQAAIAIASLHAPVVAAINGDAIGQGLELALAADLRIAASTAHFAMPQVGHGLLPWDGGTQRLARIVGRAYALELLLTGETVDAATALRMGLVNRLAPPQELRQAVDAVVGQVIAAAPIAIRYAKEAVRDGAELALAQGLRLEADLTILLQGTKDRAEGIRSFMERRPAVFGGE
ncbi:MAG: enoyl-CoA hydratase/isomerase family protein [Chloroflexi bacterium]|nr:enoyl-CoA hydratase/isomerase family protein [Chloroflexota bacterium]